MTLISVFNIVYFPLNILGGLGLDKTIIQNVFVRASDSIELKESTNSFSGRRGKDPGEVVRSKSGIWREVKPPKYKSCECTAICVFHDYNSNNSNSSTSLIVPESSTGRGDGRGGAFSMERNKQGIKYIISGFSDGRVVLFHPTTGRSMGLFCCAASIVSITTTVVVVSSDNKRESGGQGGSSKSRSRSRSRRLHGRHCDVLVVADAVGGILILRILPTWLEEQQEEEEDKEKEKEEEDEDDDEEEEEVAGELEELNAAQEKHEETLLPTKIWFDVHFHEQEGTGEENQKNLKTAPIIAEDVTDSASAPASTAAASTAATTETAAATTSFSTAIVIDAVHAEQEEIEPILDRVLAEFHERRDGQPVAGVIGVFGGAAGLYELLVPKLRSIISDGVVRLASEEGCILFDGGTASGVMEFVGTAVASLRATNIMDQADVPYLVGCTPLECADWPGRPNQPKGTWPAQLESNHDMFILASGESSHEWGAETKLMMKLVAGASKKKGGGGCAVAVLSNGGAVTKKEALFACRANIPLVLIEGSGRVTDKICRLRRTLEECAIRFGGSGSGGEKKKEKSTKMNNMWKRSVASVVASFGGDVGIMLGEHEHGKKF